MKKLIMIKHFLILILLSVSITSIAQNKVDLNFRTGVSIPASKFGDAKLNTGFGFETFLGIKVMPHLSAYGGWGWNKFSTKTSFNGADIDVEETGYTFGLRFIHPIAESNIKYVIGAGGIYNHLEIENNEGNLIADSKHGLGWQAETGISIPLNKRWAITPYARYRSLSRDIKIENNTTPVDHNYFSLGAGLSWSF
jgi:hypothetical protein